MDKDNEAWAASPFSHWPAEMRESLRGGPGLEVNCGQCVGCCSSSQFIHIQPTETVTLDRIPNTLVFPAPGLPPGHVLMGYGDDGRCPMLLNSTCTIYVDRPDTCRKYDCRIFAAAGLMPGGDEKREINERVSQWQFSYPSPKDRDEHHAVRSVATFLRENARHFPNGRVPADPGQIAVIAVKAFPIFLDAGKERTPAEMANAVVDACRAFDAKAK